MLKRIMIVTTLAFVGLGVAAFVLHGDASHTAKTLPEVYVLKIGAMEKERATRVQALDQVKRFVMETVDYSEQEIVKQACKEVMNLDLDKCAVTQGKDGSSWTIGPRPEAPPPTK